jgi:ACT domain-containing protein
MFSPLRNFSDKDVALPHPAKVTVTLLGSQSVINHISKDKITVFADLSNITVPGQYNVPLKVNIAEKEDGIKNITVKPEKVKVIISASPNN